MTYSLFEYAKENIETLLANQPEVVEIVPETKDICDSMKNASIRGMLESFLEFTTSLNNFLATKETVLHYYVLNF